MNPDLIFLLGALGVIVCLGLVGLGTVWGLKKTVIVYHGKLDLALSFLIPVLLPVAFADFGFADGINWTLKGLSGLLLAGSVRTSFAANSSLGKTLVVMPTKLVLAGLLTVCGVLAVGSLLAGTAAFQKKNPWKAAESFALGAAAATGFYCLYQLIQKLVKPRSPQTKIC
jgi:hypothetical protein